MSQLLVDEGLVDDMAAALSVIRQWFMGIAEEHAGMDTAALDDLLKRYRAETGRRPPSITDLENRA